MVLYGDIGHHRLWRVPEHLRYIQIKRLYTVALNKAKVSVSSGLSHNVHGRTFALCNPFYVVKMLFINEKTHAFLALVCNNFLGA